MPAQYVKPYVKRGKNDAADAEAICEAVTRPTMRFVPVKTPEQQSVMMLPIRSARFFPSSALSRPSGVAASINFLPSSQMIKTRVCPPMHDFACKCW